MGLAKFVAIYKNKVTLLTRLLVYSHIIPPLLTHPPLPQYHTDTIKCLSCIGTRYLQTLYTSELYLKLPAYSKRSNVMKKVPRSISCLFSIFPPNNLKHVEICAKMKLVKQINELVLDTFECYKDCPVRSNETHLLTT